GGQDDVRREGDHFCRIFPHRRIIASGPTNIDPNIASVCPTHLLQALPKRCQAGLTIWTIIDRHQHGNAWQSVWLLCKGRERPCGRAANKRDELASPHWRPRGLDS